MYYFTFCWLKFMKRAEFILGFGRRLLMLVFALALALVFRFASSTLLLTLSHAHTNTYRHFLPFASVSLSYKSREKSLANRLNVFWARKRWKSFLLFFLPFRYQTRRLTTENLWRKFFHRVLCTCKTVISIRHRISWKFIWFVLCIKSNYLIKN